MAPSGDAGDDEVVSGLERFTGDVFVVYGEALWDLFGVEGVVLQFVASFGFHGL